MPTLDDTPILPTIAGANVAAGDLVLVYDVSDKTIKAITLDELVTALDALGLAADA